jgi:hypothetical protein
VRDLREAASDPEPLDLPDADPDIAAHVVAIRDRFGVSGMRQAATLLAVEIALAEEALRELTSD